MTNQTDWRQQSAMQTSQSDRGWDFRPMQYETSLRPWFIAGLCVVIFVGMCMIASVANV